MEDGEVREVTREARENAKAVLKVSSDLSHIYNSPRVRQSKALPLRLSIHVARNSGGSLAVRPLALR